ncbi:hypothetical protein Pcinc_010566 [Petrolisthes cinctipes]|uniref:Uncharacterized protein n=1 Tax=Petrolisthes cinctipes TaxID=88211 RepID=A0AAE1G2V3_PETCI|nr:hypothetical protein Pcinc_010566 [Petrolisthes cinctipes]
MCKATHIAKKHTLHLNFSHHYTSDRSKSRNFSPTMLTRLHFTLLILLLPFSLCEVSGEKLMVHNQEEQIEEQLGLCRFQGTECEDIGGTCYHNSIPMEKCNGVVNVMPNICEGSECYCCLELEATNTCTQTMECKGDGVDPGKCVDDVKAYLDRKAFYVSELNCEEPDCSCVHRCQEKSKCRKFNGRCFPNEVTNCKKGYTMLQECGCKNVESCGCCVPDAVAYDAAAAMGC